METDVLPEPITKPGVYPDLPVDVYHADPVPGRSLSSSGARKLLPPSCPALYHYERENPAPPSDTFEFGHAAHQRVLGVGPELVVVNAEAWTTNAVKAEVEAIRAEGKVPIKPSALAVVGAMAEAIKAHPVASALLGDGGTAEASMFWTDNPTGTWRRARLDWLPTPKRGRQIGTDYKTSRSADPEKFARAAMDYGYHCQAAWYLDGLIELGVGDKDTAFVFIVQEKTPPYLVSVVQLDVVALRIGRVLNRRALDIYAECESTGIWPGYSDDVALASLPFWYERQFEGETA